jgi:thiosulfate reductase cytochrome b subunit
MYFIFVKSGVVVIQPRIFGFSLLANHSSIWVVHLVGKTSFMAFLILVLALLHIAPPNTTIRFTLPNLSLTVLG